MNPRLEAPDNGIVPQSCFIEPVQESGQVPFAHYMWVLQRHKWKVVAFVAFCGLLSYVISARLPASYEATATLEVDRRTPSGIVGHEAKEFVLNDADQFLATQAKILQTDAVLRPVAIKYNLLSKDEQAASAPSSNGKPAPDSPVILKKLRITRLPSTYLLQINYRANDPKLAADVANGIATSYVEYTFNSRVRSSSSLAGFMQGQIDELRAKMERSSGALASFEKELNVINPEEKTNILSARLLQLNSEYTAAQTDRVRKQLAFQSIKDGTLESAQVSAQGVGLGSLTDRLNQAENKFADISAHFGSNHPEYKRQAAEIVSLKSQIEQAKTSVTKRTQIEFEQADARESMLKAAVASTKAEFDRLNARSYQYQTLKREADADRKLFEELNRGIKEAGINANFQNNAIRIADFARPADDPVSPNVPMYVSLSMFGSFLLAIGAVLVGESIDKTVRDPVQLARLLNVDVIAQLPVINDRRPKMVAAGTDQPAGALVKSAQFTNEYEESVRVLRSTIFLTDFDRRPKSVLVTSALPGEGKTTTALQLCRAHAQQKRRTLLIDADLRRPSIHTRLNLPASAGLAAYLSGEKDWREVTVEVPDEPYLNILPAGRVSRAISDLAIQALPRLLDEMGSEYDLIVVDSQPMLGFSEPLQIATVVDGVIVIARTGKTDRAAVSSVMSTLNRVHARTLGVVLNRVAATNNGYYGYANDYVM
jgi:succinoglycan biosynthesis transport protein ExoP